MWFDYFHAQFDALAADLGVVLDASGCREGWLQGELFRRSPDQDFAVNTYPYTDIGGKADLEGLRPCVTGGEAAMVAELKVVGGRFAKKCLDGRNWTNAACWTPTVRVQMAESCLYWSRSIRLQATVFWPTSSDCGLLRTGSTGT
ncbi:hypothetical protein [Azospirillum argentinense]|uniref:hypothetical protein n=1 Tax=Azospirillum argentinense TaxID=2970906 RepID=UPI0010C11F0D|nr:hypothetical protein [Azospirillum argentinense]